MAKKKTKSSAPSGLSLVRDKTKFTLGWKIPSCKYADGQQFNYMINDTGNDKWQSITIGKTTTSKAVSIDKANFYPNNSKYLYDVRMRVRGNRDAKSDKYIWSDWSSKIFEINIPNKPTCSFELDGQVSYKGTFSWAVDTSDTNSRIYTRVQWETILVKDCDVTDGDQIKGQFKTTALGWDTGTSTATSGTKTITEDSALFQGLDYSYTRWFRIRSQGPRGASDWRYSRHVYAIPYKSSNLSIDCTEVSGGYMPSVKWTSPSSSAHRPIGKTEVQYTKQKPTNNNLACPDSGFDWSVGAVVNDTADEDGATFYIEGRLSDDECLYIRVNNYHDDTVRPGTATLAKVGRLKALSSFSVTVDSSDPPTYRATIAAVSASEVTAPVKRAIQYVPPSGEAQTIAILEDNNSHIVQCPNWGDAEDVSFKAYAFIGTATLVDTSSTGVTTYEVNAKMTSPTETFSLMGEVPKAPEDVAVNRTDLSGTVQVTWDWSWSKANGAELSWANHMDAWESTDQPETYDVTAMGASRWNISELALGQTWYIRVRLYTGNGDDRIYGPYSEIVPIKLLSAPDIPLLKLSAGIIPEDGVVTASWVYISTDSTPQTYAELALESQGEYTVIAHTDTAQHITLRPSDWEAQSGQTYNLALRVKSASGVLSEWSDIQPIIIADVLTCEISQTSLVTETIIDDEDEPLVTRTVNSLKDLPLTLTVAGSSPGLVTTVVIERADSFHLAKPDERAMDGYKGETIFLHNYVGIEANAISIDYDSLVGSLDDGASYNLIVTIYDELGQSATATPLSFEVHWTHQAEIPSAKIVIDQDELIAKITPKAPRTALATDVCDIYRLSVDKPELVYAGAEFGTTYVDPYPTLGQMGGYRIVTRTKNGDYTTADNVIAWFDTREQEIAIIENTEDLNIVDFGEGQIRFYYDSDLSHTWTKDFERTQYLGGSIQGDWNPAVNRDGTLSSLAITTLDQEMLQLVRRLAVYDGPCHIRTSDGSSFTANIEVSEESNHSDLGMRVSYTLKLEQVGTEGFDGMTLAEWNSLQ